MAVWATPLTRDSFTSEIESNRPIAPKAGQCGFSLVTLLARWAFPVIEQSVALRLSG
jgi:hypothetical protein